MSDARWMLLPISPPSNLHHGVDNLCTEIVISTILIGRGDPHFHKPHNALPGECPVIVDKVTTLDVICCAVMVIVTTMDKSQCPIHSRFSSPQISSQSSQLFGDSDSRRSRSLQNGHAVIIETEREK